MAQSVLVKDYNDKFTFMQTSKITTVTIANGGTTSGAVDVSGFTHVTIVMPSAWTTATLGVEVSNALAGTYVPLHDSSGAVAITIAASQAITLDIQSLIFIKLKASASQAAARTITLLLGR